MQPRPEPTVIKKYANRRLYNTGTSTYVTLEDLAVMVRKGEDFLVTDAKTGEDITRTVLTQIIFELENSGGQNLLPISFLRQLIGFYGDQMQALVPSYLQFSMERLTREQDSFREQVQKAWKGDVFGAMQDQARASMTIFQEAFRVFSPFAPGGTTAPQPEAKAGDDLDAMRKQIDEMRQKLDRMGR
jgi:polyhydroxyalkanoate synthesis repressor PhaR